MRWFKEYPTEFEMAHKTTDLWGFRRVAKLLPRPACERVSE